MSNAQRAFDLRTPGRAPQGRLEFERGNFELNLQPGDGTEFGETGLPRGQLLHISTGPSNFFGVYLSPARWPNPETVAFPLILTWEVWIGGAHTFDGRRLFMRKTVYTSRDTKRKGLLFSMAGPVFENVLLVGYISSMPAVTINPTTNGSHSTVVGFNADALIGMSGAVSDLKVRVGNMVG